MEGLASRVALFVAVSYSTCLIQPKRQFALLSFAENLAALTSGKIFPNKTIFTGSAVYSFIKPRKAVRPDFNPLRLRKESLPPN
jgi:hypothetical protein